MNPKLSFQEILTNGFKMGLANFVPMIIAVILWLLTFWIPYVNVGTTIALATFPAQLSKGQIINPMSIFDAKYRRFMGDYFLVVALQTIIVGCGYAFMIIPGIIMQYSYIFAPLLVIDKGMGASEALNTSNKLTTGYKASIFLSFLVITIPVFVLSFIPALMVIYLIILMPISIAIIGYIYGVLTTTVVEEVVVDQLSESHNDNL